MREEIPEVPPKFLQIKQDDKFFSRLLSKEGSKGGGEASFRVLYYGRAAGSIPFMWESQPGTPKHPSLDNSLPPLTPPPSYQLSTRMKNTGSNSKPNFLGSLFSRKSSRRTSNDKLGSFSSSSSVSYTSSSRSMPSTPMDKTGNRKNKGHTRSASSVQFQIDDEEDENKENKISPTSTLCFGGGIRCGRPMKKVMTRAFWSISGHGTAN